MLRGSKKHGSWFVTVPLAVGVALFYWLVFSPMQQEIQAMREELDQKQDYVVATVSDQAAIEAATREIEQARRYADAWLRPASTGGRLPEVVRDINQQAIASGALVRRLDPQPATAMQTLRRMPVSISLSGSFDQLVRVLASLESMKQALWVNEIHLDRKSEDRGDVQCRAEMVVFANKTGISD